MATKKTTTTIMGCEIHGKYTTYRTPKPKRGRPVTPESKLKKLTELIEREQKEIATLKAKLATTAKLLARHIFKHKVLTAEINGIEYIKPRKDIIP